MKTRSILPLLQAALLLLLASCTQEEFPAAQDNKTQQLAISVTDGGYAATASPTTRTAEMGYTTEFTAGDACGIYVVRGTQMVYSNVKLIAERDAATGKLVWKAADGTVLAGMPNDQCYLYYPYRPDMDARPPMFRRTQSTSATCFSSSRSSVHGSRMKTRAPAKPTPLPTL